MPTDAARAQVFFELMTGYRVSQALYVAAKLGIADLLAAGPRSAEDLAHTAGAHPASLHRLLRALVSVDVFAEDDDGRFALAEVGECLRTDAPDSQRATAIFYGDHRHWETWGKLLHSVQTGETGRGTHAVDFAALAREDPEGAAIFNDAMTALTRTVDAAVASAYDFSRIRTLIDVAGGHGGLLTSLLRAHPHLRGVLFDIPPVIEGARARVEGTGVASRVELVAGSFFESVPAGGDAYLLKWIIHDWDDERSVTILTNCRRAMGADGTLLLVERIVPARVQQTATHQSILFADLNMLALTGGRERSEAEYRSLLGAAGFRLARIIPTASPMCIIEGVPGV
jgi:hypothetical protein